MRSPLMSCLDEGGSHTPPRITWATGKERATHEPARAVHLKPLRANRFHGYAAHLARMRSAPLNSKPWMKIQVFEPGGAEQELADLVQGEVKNRRVSLAVAASGSVGASWRNRSRWRFASCFSPSRIRMRPRR